MKQAIALVFLLAAPIVQAGPFKSDKCKESDICTLDNCICAYQQPCNSAPYNKENCDAYFKLRDDCAGTGLSFFECCPKYGYCVTKEPTPAPTVSKSDVDCKCSPLEYQLVANDYKGIDLSNDICEFKPVDLRQLCKNNPLETGDGIPGIRTFTELVDLSSPVLTAMCYVCTKAKDQGLLDPGCDDISGDAKELALNVFWTGVEDLSECVDPQSTIDLTAEGGLISSLISGTASVIKNINQIYGSFCSSLPNRSKEAGTFKSGTPYTLPSKLSQKLKSGTCIDKQSTKDVVRGTRLKLVGEYLTANAESFKSVEVTLYWEYTNCCADGQPFMSPVNFWAELFGGTPVLTISQSSSPKTEWCSADADTCKGGPSDVCEASTQVAPWGDSDGGRLLRGL